MFVVDSFLLCGIRCCVIACMIEVNQLDAEAEISEVPAEWVTFFLFLIF